MTRKKHLSRAKRVTNASFAIFLCLCNTCDMDSLGNSMYFMSQIDGSLVQIHTKFHDFSMLFIQVLFVFHMPKHDMDFTEVQVMVFPWHDRENDPLDFIEFSHFQPNCHQKDIRNCVSHFLQGWYDSFLHCQSPLSNGIWFVEIKHYIF